MAVDGNSDGLGDYVRRWEETTLDAALEKRRERRDKFTTLSGLPVERLYTPLDVSELNYERDLANPGDYPYTRGIHATGYRGKPWTTRIFAGFGSAEETNARYQYLFGTGNMGLSVAFDLPTLMGYDSDAPEALGEFGKCGVAVNCLRDMEILFRGIPLGEVSTSMTINGPAAVIWAYYLVAAQRQGVPLDQLRGTLQNDILKEYIAQKEYIFPPRPAMRLVTDTIEFAARHLPKWNSISVSGYHIREAGSTAAQELAFTLLAGTEYLRWALARGLDIDEFAPRISFFFNAHNDFFEEICQVSGGAADLGAANAGDLRRARSAQLVDALSRADSRRQFDRAAAGSESCAGGNSGAGGCAWRRAVAAYQQYG